MPSRTACSAISRAVSQSSMQVRSSGLAPDSNNNSTVNHRGHILYYYIYSNALIRRLTVA